ncbi:MAG: hypothetical protein ACI9D5_003010 [Candidatus Endobugula sp.]|jgi:hypothetical protein
MNVSLLSYNELISQLSNSQADIAEFSTLEKIVRQGHQPDSPKLLTRYLEIGRSYAVHKPQYLQIKIYTAILDTLLDTICDHCIAVQWRQLCLDNCYRPLSILETLITNDQEKHHLQQQYYKLRTLSHYFH